ncbi:hypothetical protein [Variovorax paradoxus]
MSLAAAGKARDAAKAQKAFGINPITLRHPLLHSPIRRWAQARR